MLTLPNVATQDVYVPALQLGPVATCQGIKYVVANAAVLAQLAPLSKSGTLEDWGEELLITPETNSIAKVGGIRFKSAVPGVPAQVVAQLYFPADPQFGSGTPFSGTLSGSGGIQPGVSDVKIGHNGAVIGTESELDFLDSGANIWAVVDDPANTRVRVTPPRIITGVVSAAGGASGGSGYTVVRNAAGDYTVTFTTPFGVFPLVTVAPINVFAVSAYIGQPGPNNFRINWRDPDAAGGLDVPWEFIAVAIG